jgi:hypothetical protein
MNNDRAEVDELIIEIADYKNDFADTAAEKLFRKCPSLICPLSVCTPQALLLTIVKDEIRCSKQFSSFNLEYAYDTIFARSSVAICKLNVPMYDSCVGSQTKDALDIDVLNIDVHTRELVEILLEPSFDSGLSLESAASRYFAGVD